MLADAPAIPNDAEESLGEIAVALVAVSKGLARLESKAPVVNVAPPQVRVESPVVNVAAPKVNVEHPAPNGWHVTVTERDAHDRIKSLKLTPLP